MGILDSPILWKRDAALVYACSTNAVSQSHAFVYWYFEHEFINFWIPDMGLK